MVGDARLLILLPLETRQVAPDNTVVLMLKPGNQTYTVFSRERFITVTGYRGFETKSQLLETLHGTNKLK